jgi:serine/threonine-protein kinase HipA
MVFNVIARNCDDHTRNFAFLLNKDKGWALSPAFDVCHSYRPGSTWVNQQSLSVNGKRQNITHADFLSVAKQMSIKKVPAILEQVNTVVQNWPRYAAEVDVSRELTASIQKTLIKIDL